MENPFELLKADFKKDLQEIHLKLDKALSLIPDEDQDLLTPQEFAKAVKKTMPTIWRWETEGKINPILIAGKKFYKNPKK